MRRYGAIKSYFSNVLFTTDILLLKITTLQSLNFYFLVFSYLLTTPKI